MNYDSILGLMRRRYEIMFPEEFRGEIIEAVNVFDAIDQVESRLDRPTAVHLQHIPD